MRFLAPLLLALLVVIGPAISSEVTFVPRSVVLMIERSDDTRWQSLSIRSFACDLIDQLALGTEVVVYEFNSETTELAHTPSLTESQRKLIKERVPQVGSRDPYTNFDLVLDELRKWSKRPCLVVFVSRGISNPSTGHSFVHLLPLLKSAFPASSGHSVLFVGLSDAISKEFKSRSLGSHVSYLRLDTRTNRPTLILDRFLYAQAPERVKPAVPRPIATRISKQRPTRLPTRIIKARPTRIPTRKPTLVPRIVVKPSLTPPPTFTPTRTPTTTPTNTLTPSPTPTVPIVVLPEDSDDPPLGWPWRRILSLALVGSILLVALFIAMVRRAARTALVEDLPADDEERVVEVVVTRDDDGSEVFAEEFVIGSNPQIVTVGSNDSSEVFIPNIEVSRKFRILPSGDLQQRSGFSWKDIFPGERIELGSHLVLSATSYTRPVEEV